MLVSSAFFLCMVVYMLVNNHIHTSPSSLFVWHSICTAFLLTWLHVMFCLFCLFLLPCEMCNMLCFFTQSFPPSLWQLCKLLCLFPQSPPFVWLFVNNNCQIYPQKALSPGKSSGLPTDMAACMFLFVRPFPLFMWHVQATMLLYSFFLFYVIFIFCPILHRAFISLYMFNACLLIILLFF